MAQRKLARIKLPGGCDEALRREGVTLAKDIINKSRQELVSQLGLHAQLCDELYSAVAANICPEPRSVLDCMQAKQAAVCFLRTGMASFDKILRGGIPCGGITEIVGPAGAGKTQFCLQSCVRAIGECGAHGSAIYIDTESRFSAERLLEMAQVLYPTLSGSEQRKFVERCIVYSVQSTQELTQTLSSIEEAVIEKSVKIIVVDSVASLARHEFNGAALASRQAELTKEAQTLKFLGESNNIPVIVTNQVTTRYQSNLPASRHRCIPHQPAAERDSLQDDDSFLTAALGPAWSHCVNTRVVLEQNPQTRLLTVAKSPIAPVTQINFAITAGGIKLTSEPILADENFWTMRINTLPTEVPQGDGNLCHDVFPDAAPEEWDEEPRAVRQTGLSIRH
eukprot:Tamp_16298.p1 GENE.Tamp_16298~~Tamp_16298.p1  ORF type:complete len:405 (-),score=58.39 Tamp_16298:259-1440(-)